jgi:phosphoribosylformimino-5-aminoimidazole carboxamide ribonucleotide (ProFAR) isomerase
MRVGTILLLQNMKCVQSYDWCMFRKLGSLQGILDSLGDYQCDEISIVRPVRDNDSKSDFIQDVSALKKASTMTPVSFGGGIRTIEYIDLLVDLPVERLTFSSAFIHGDADLLGYAKSLFGTQAIQCVLPLFTRGGVTKAFISSSNSEVDIEHLDWEFINSYANEIVIYDVDSDGASESFDFNLLDSVYVPDSKIVISGGIGSEVIKKAKLRGIASVLIDNKVLHREFSIRGYKNA